MRIRCWWCVLAVLIAAPQVQAQEEVAKSKVVSVGLFKNGLVIVKREVQIPKDGVYRLDTMLEPVHGSFWIESTGKVEAAIKMRDVEVPLHSEAAVGGLRTELAGKKVTITFRNDKIAPVTGMLVKVAKQPAPESLPAPTTGGEGMWILQTAKGRLYFSPTDVMLIQTEDADEKVKHRKPVLVLTVEKQKKQPAVYVSYLTNGLAWAPSYRVDLTNPKSLAVEMAAVIRNEMSDLNETEIKLISGFPSVEFANVTSPFSAHATWSRFFGELAGRHHHRHDDGLLQQRLVSNTVSYEAPIRPKIDLGATPAGEGVDLHFESIGKRTLLRDEALAFTVGSAKADYERVIEWTVGTSRTAVKYGITEQRKDEMWDVVVFRNPFKFPMTTAPAMVVENGRFNGQRTSYWTNVGEENWLKITRSLSVRALAREQEDGKANERVIVDDKSYTKIYLKGELLMNNHRKEPIKMYVRHTIRGVIHEIEGDPVRSTREDSLEAVNRVYDVVWTVLLQPGEEKRLTYRNSVLVYR